MLTRDPESEPAFHDKLRGLAIRMVSKGDSADQQIRIVVTFQTLAKMGQTEIEDCPAALPSGG
jgi:hypothetical protein